MSQPYRRIFMLLLMLLLALPAAAQETPPDNTLTPARLERAAVPPRDLLDLAMRLDGLQFEEIVPPPENPPALTAGTVDTFWVSDSANDRSFEVDAELRVVGEHIYLWVEQGADVDQADLERLADDFDTTVYEPVRELWGSENSPGIDGDPRVHGLFARDMGGGVAAYFAGKHAYSQSVVPTSNQREMFFYNLDAVSSLLGTFDLTSITAHEFQHMIRANVDSNEDGWLDEGFSEFTQLYLGDDNAFAAVTFQQNPGTQLNTWTENGNRTADYGASGMWVTYLYERVGADGLRQLSADPANGMIGVDNLARQFNTTADELFADWVVANFVLDPDDAPGDIYGYREFYPSLNGPFIGIYQADSLPISDTRTINQYATNYIAVSRLNGRETLNMQISVADSAKLAPTESPTGTPMWYSNRGDDSNTHVTFSLNLTDTENPTLTYDLWYHIENLWDYGYLMVSAEGSDSWDIIETPRTTTENPHFNAYGPGYTGRSGGGDTSEWVTESVSLADYAGQQVMVRFEMIYDDAVNQPGMLIDRVQATDGDETLYETDFSDPTAASAWPAAGWILTDNQLPQNVWVQAIQQIGDEYTLDRWRFEGGEASYTVDLNPDASSVTIALSPFAPVTTVPADVTLTLE